MINGLKHDFFLTGIYSRFLRPLVSKLMKDINSKLNTLPFANEDLLSTFISVYPLFRGHSFIQVHNYMYWRLAWKPKNSKQACFFFLKYEHTVCHTEWRNQLEHTELTKLLSVVFCVHLLPFVSWFPLLEDFHCCCLLFCQYSYYTFSLLYSYSFSKSCSRFLIFFNLLSQL